MPQTRKHTATPSPVAHAFQVTKHTVPKSALRKLVQNKLLPLPPPPAPVRQRCSRTGHPRLPGSDWAGCFPHLPLPHPDPARSRSNSTHLAERGREGAGQKGPPGIQPSPVWRRRLPTGKALREELEGLKKGENTHIPCNSPFEETF